MKLTRRIPALLLAILLLAALLLPVLADRQPGQTHTILFTHDMHSHLLSAVDESGVQYGGYARLKTVIDSQRAKYGEDILLLDGGDFSMGTLFQTAYATSATELRIMGALGYDAATFGNHEYDYRASGLAHMLNAAVASGDPLPAIVESNYLPPYEGDEGYNEDAAAVWAAFENYGVAEYILLERGGVPYVIFGITGEDSHACAPMSGMIHHDPVDTAKRVVEEATEAALEQYGAEPIVICLSHSGTSGGKGEDYELAKKVDGIHVIVSGHTHTTLYEPIEVNGTLIVSCGEYSKNLGVLNFTVEKGKAGAVHYELVPVDSSVAEDADVAAFVEDCKQAVDEDYLRDFGMTFDQVLVNSSFPFESQNQTGATQHESTLGNLLSDAYKWAAEEATGQPVDMALTAMGVIRESLPQGDITVSDVFNMASLGIGADGVPGYPLVCVYVTGKDLKNAFEVDASVQPLMHAAQLFCSGVEYSFNTNRMIFNKVTECALRRADGSLETIDDEKLYRVVTGLYCGQMLGEVEGKSFGILSITPRDEAGNPISMDKLEEHIIHRADGSELKEWHAIATYLQTMGGEMDSAYAAPDGRKNVYSSWHPAELVKNINKVTLVVLAVVLVVLVVLILVIRAVWLGIYRRRGYRRTKGYHGYRGR